MRFTAGASSTRSWQPMPTADTTDLRFWLRWRVAVCTLWVLCCVAAAAYLIWRHEGPRAHRRIGAAKQDAAAQGRRRPDELLYDDEAWRPCLRDIHPAWLLVYRLVSFVLFSLLIVISDGGNIFLSTCLIVDHPAGSLAHSSGPLPRRSRYSSGGTAPPHRYGRICLCSAEGGGRGHGDMRHPFVEAEVQARREEKKA
ncbi:hypothetical protein VPH35_054768 [Triticum aestivum]|uniref:Uncharacterized protein n=1 Tax=Triticum turgidum subsp. durum TaxID=4567 RepID=A0A9R1QUJ3_TRITD|nr:uncharacterized protein LOC123071984 [Triticum aestivum]VAH83610.1 unnamed protein product [Triticum turgidum subsp. durum]